MTHNSMLPKIDFSLNPLIEMGLIDSYEKTDEGLYGLKFTIKRSKKGNPNENDLQK